MNSERKISCRLISRERNSCKEISGRKKSYPEKRYLSWRIMLEKIFRGLGKVKSLPKPNSPFPFLFVCVFLILFWMGHVFL